MGASGIGWVLLLVDSTYCFDPNIEKSTRVGESIFPGATGVAQDFSHNDRA